MLKSAKWRQTPMLPRVGAPWALQGADRIVSGSACGVVPALQGREAKAYRLARDRVAPVLLGKLSKPGAQLPGGRGRGQQGAHDGEAKPRPAVPIAVARISAHRASTPSGVASPGHGKPGYAPLAMLVRARMLADLFHKSPTPVSQAFVGCIDGLRQNEPFYPVAALSLRGFVYQKEFFSAVHQQRNQLVPPLLWDLRSLFIIDISSRFFPLPQF